ncbi:MAG TPA: transketolase C-terminal domain-containing protein [Chthonomonadales bacterium]|nr:transketolase C-terminal domain-containing protein [Chthonomonadales bacterium]
MREAFVRTLTSLAEEDARVVLVTGDVGFGVLADYARRFPRQFLNAGISEQNMTGVATGLALTGRVVYTYSIGNFPTLRCLEQIRNDACYHRANVKVVAVGGGFSYGALGISHHATEDLAIMRSLPDITVVAPGDCWEAEHATRAIHAHSGACYLRLDRASIYDAQPDDGEFRIGRARIVREGRDITLICAGGILDEARIAADALAVEGIQCRVVSMHTLKPLDSAAIFAACAETGGIVTVEEHTVVGGLGSAVAEVCLESGLLPRCFKRVGLRAGFSSIVGDQSYLRHCYGMDADAIATTVRALIYGAADGALGVAAAVREPQAQRTR